MNDFLKNFDPMVNKALRLFNVPGAAIGLVVEGEKPLVRGYGIRDFTKKLPVTEKSMFCIASCTKAFTSKLLGQLVEEGRLAWDDPVIQYIPEFRLFDSKLTSAVTLRDLLAHRTGIARHDAVLFFSELEKSEVTRNDILGFLHYFKPVLGLREKFLYNNFMYSVAAIVTERVLKQTWEEAMVSRLFKPLNMQDTNVTSDQLKMSKDLAYPYAEIDGMLRQLPFYDIPGIRAGGGVNSNVLDMTKWIQQHLFNFNNKMFKEMYAVSMPMQEPRGGGVDYQGLGLGWFIGTYREHEFVGHGGLIDGFTSDVALLPQKKIGLVILTNSSTDGQYVIDSIRNTIFDKLLGGREIDWIKQEQENRHKAKETLQPLEKAIPPANDLHSVLDYQGSYEHPVYGVVQVFSQEKGRLCALYRDIHIPLIHQSKDVFKGTFQRLLHFGVSPIIDFTFIKHPSGEFRELQIPFEAFRAAEPIVFTRKTTAI